jgi:hypothetical protein
MSIKLKISPDLTPVLKILSIAIMCAAMKEEAGFGLSIATGAHAAWLTVIPKFHLHHRGLSL